MRNYVVLAFGSGGRGNLFIHLTVDAQLVEVLVDNGNQVGAVGGFKHVVNRVPIKIYGNTADAEGFLQASDVLLLLAWDVVRRKGMRQQTKKHPRSNE